MFIDALEADFHRFYGIRLSIALNDLTWREFLTRVNNLPSEANYWRRIDEYNKVKEIENDVVGMFGW